MVDGSVFVKLDFRNAFNCLRRDALLESVFREIPGIYNFCHSSYLHSSILKFGTFTLSSEEGPQQGDPLGPLLFCLAEQHILDSLSSSVIIGFLDDLSLGGPEDVVARDVDHIIVEAAKLGLKLNTGKCEVISTPNSVLTSSTLQSFVQVTPSNATLLGAPLLTGPAMDGLLKSRCEDLKRAMDRLSLISSHDALVILKSALSAPKLTYTIRSSPCSGHTELDNFDNLLRKGLSDIVNVNLTDLAWVQANLPVREGGLGIRSVALLAPSAFLASAAGTLDLQMAILSRVVVPNDPAVQATLAVWCSRHKTCAPVDNAAKLQCNWDQASIDVGKDILSAGFQDPHNKARLLATSAPFSSDWLTALPISSCGLRLDNDAVRIAVGLRLGAPLGEAHTCVCGHAVDVRGIHGLACRRSASRMSRHQIINDLVYRALTRAGIPSVKEPQGLSRTDGKRPDGLTLIPWRSGRCLTWDVTVIDTFADSYLAQTSTVQGSASEIAAERKNDKYKTLQHTYEFCPLALETLGPVNTLGREFLSDLGRRLTEVTGDFRETIFLRQRISIAIQRCNAAAIRGTFSQILETAI
jgi:hypothetical protein